MYGKIFGTLFEGSMCGSGPAVFAVWAYCIAKADQDGTVLLNPLVLAAIIGTSRATIEQAIEYLKAPDPHSKNGEHEGRRLLHQTGHLYFLVSHAQYRGIKSNEDRREYMREYMRKKRDLLTDVNTDVNSPANSELTKVNPASASVSSSASDSEGEFEGDTTRIPQGYHKDTAGIPRGHQGDIKVISKRYQDDITTAFDTFWKAYPRKVGKDQARKAWAARKKDLPPIADLLAAVKAQSASTQWTRDGGEYIPHPSTWLNQGRWQDEGIDVAQVTPRKTLSARDRMNMTSDEIAAHERTHGVQGELLT